MIREQLMQERDSLKNKLDEVQKQLDELDAEIYGGKMEKAIELLSECLDYLHYPMVPFDCPTCEKAIDIDLNEVINGLQVLYRGEF